VRAERALAERVLVLESILESVGEGIIVADEHRRLVLANPGGRHVLGGIAFGDALPEGVEWSMRAGMYREDGETPFPIQELPLRRAIRGEATDGVPMVIRNERFPGGLHLHATGRPIRDADNVLRGGVVTLTDVTALKHAQQRLAQLAVTDELTQLPNLRALRSRLELASVEAARGRRFSVAIADIDHFKHVNDAHGHAAGDKVLAGIARILQGSVRKGDLVARLGGEEFCIVQTDVDEPQAYLLAERLRAGIAAMDDPPAVTASFGVCHSARSADPERMLALADAALYRAKRGGRNCVVMADSADSDG
jgi:diguanylate cyclase (GGDEF)-like protein